MNFNSCLSTSCCIPLCQNERISRGEGEDYRIGTWRMRNNEGGGPNYPGFIPL